MNRDGAFQAWPKSELAVPWVLLEIIKNLQHLKIKCAVNLNEQDEQV